MSKNERKNSSELIDWIKSILWAVLIALLIRTFLVEVFLVDGPSMIPTLQDEQRLIVNKIGYRLFDPKPGDIVVFTYSPERDFIKRIVAVEGDSVEVKQGTLYINGEPREENFINEPMIGSYGPVTVPENSLFVMGDNRKNSMDSRDPSVGFVSMEQVKGKAVVIFWPITDMKILSSDNT